MLQGALIALITVAAAAGYRRLPLTVRSEVARCVRDVRVRTGSYGLRLLMQRMVDEMLASVLPSITRSYVPNEMTFGLHPVDAQRWGGYFDRLAEELNTAMISEIRGRDDLYLNEAAGLTIVLVTDAGAAPGRPSFSARMHRATRVPVKPAPTGPDVHDGGERIDMAAFGCGDTIRFDASSVAALRRRGD